MSELKLTDGTYVPGATTIIGQMDKPFLVSWANRMGLKGVDTTKYTADAAKRGTLVHMILESYVTNIDLELDDKYSDDDVTKALPHLEYYKTWEKEHNVVPLWCEHSFVSEKYKFGGILDFYAIVDGKHTVIDFKTSKQISEGFFLQLSSYIQLLRENNLPVEQAMVINVGKNDNDKFLTDVRSAESLDNYFELFKVLVELYWKKKEIGWKD